MGRKIITLVLFSCIALINVFARELPFYNGGFEVWESTLIPNWGLYMDMASGWDVESNSWPIDLRKTDTYHSEGHQYSPRTGNYAMYFFDQSFSRQIRTKEYTLAEGTYTFSVYASTLGWADTYITLSVTGEGIDLSNKMAVTGKEYSKYSITFTLEETHSVKFGIYNKRTNNGNGSITHFVADDCSLETTDGELISTAYDYIPTENPNYKYFIYSNGEAEIIQCNTKGISGSIELPSVISKDGVDYKVRKICDNAFEGCTNIEQIILPSYLLEIGKNAFKNCTLLTTVIVPNRVTSILTGAFAGCNKLTSVELFTKNKVALTDDAFPNNSNFYLYVPNINDYVDVSNINIRTLGYSASSIEYSGVTPNVSFSFAPGVSATSIDQTTLSPNAGIYNLPASFKHASGLYVDGFINFEVNKKSLVVTANDANRLYGDNNPVFTASYEGFVNNENELNLESLPTIYSNCDASSPIGTYVIVVNNAKSNNYAISYINGVLTINKASLSVFVNDCTKTYGQANPAFTCRYEGLKNNETTPDWLSAPTYTTEATTSSDVGKYDINVNCVAKNYEVSITKGTLSITKAPLVVKATNASRLYYSSDVEYNFTCSGFVNNEDNSVLIKFPSFSTDATLDSNVGSYTITPYDAVANNYEISYETGVLTINKRELTAFAENKTKYYGDSNPIFSVKYEGFVNGQNESDLISQPTASCIANTSSNIGNYDITLDGGSATNYTIKLVKGVLTIIKAPLTVFVNDCTKTYGQANPAFTCSYEGLKNNETTPQWITTPSYSTEATTTSDVGTYDITVNCVAKNYEVTCIEGKLTITKAQLIIKANNETRLYYDNNPEFSFTCYGLQNSDNVSILTKDPTIECEASILSKVGSYPIHISNADCRNYNISYEDGVLIINKRELDVYPKDATRKYAENNPVFDCVINGFVNNEDINVLIQKPIVYTNATTFSDVGTYEIFAKEADADNYSFNYHQGTLTITKADQVITWEQSFEDIVIGDQIELLAVSSSGLDIEYIFDTDIVSLYKVGDKQFLDCLASGTFAIRATQSGNNNYNAAVRVAKTIEIIDPSSIVDIQTDTNNKPLYFDIFGRHLSNPKQGFIIRNQNDITKKILIK